MSKMQTPSPDHRALKAATQQMGSLAWPTILLGVSCIAGFVSAPLMVVQGLISLWLAVIVIALVTYASYTVMHDAVHGAIVGRHRSLLWLQNLLGYSMGFILGFPFSGHRYEHIAHHRHTNHAELDPDFQIGDMGRSPLHAVRSAFRLLSGQYGYYLKHQWHRASAREKSVMATETVLAWAARIAFMAQGYWMEGVLMFVVGSLLGLIALIYLFAYIVHRPHTAVERYLDTSTIVLRGPANNLLTWCWLFQNYHSIHHLFPKVPFYKYKALFEEIEPIMRAKGAPIYELTGGGLKPIPA